MSTSERIHDRLIRRDVEAEQALPEGVRRDVPRNGLRLVLANALQSSGDQTVNASTVLPWLFHALGVPAALTGVLVPIRESGSMLPQALLTPLVLRVRHRKHVFVAGALVQAASVAVMAGTAALGRGLAAGVVIIAALAVFALGRCLCSISSKDVQGRTVPKGERGQINGLATTASGLVAITLGLGVRTVGGGDIAAAQLVWLLAAGAALWVLVAAVYITVREPADDTAAPSIRGTDEEPNWFVQTFSMLRRDQAFRTFVTVRSFLLVSALSPPFVVVLAVRSGTEGLGGLGGFILASGVAALLGGRVFGRLADRSSKRLMAGGAAFASGVIVLLVLAVTVLDVPDGSVLAYVLFVGCYFLLTLTHTGVRVGRKTYIVDLAEGDRRTTYVAVSNSAMGLVLLVVGALSSALATFGVTWALLFLAGLGLLGVLASARLPEVSQGS
ncbi:MFS transporter [Janibacter cremeus]|uniref:MFS transporter n=1 Tax=Janibacter cremeus TaxID=1285192 RepID=UPI0023F6FD14|nr:MFS transporter [Janibacter cremeus]WEV78716.1 MFS transporter [Janibacter cremeus]